MKEYTITIPCKTYIRKYFSAQYGALIDLSLDNDFGDSILTKLSSKPLKRPTQNFLNIAFRDFDDELKFKIPIHFFYRLQHNVTSQHIWTINRYLQNIFEADLFIITNIAVVFGTERTKAREVFARHYNIILDEDIGFYGLKKAEQRIRKIKTAQNNFLAILARDNAISLRMQ